MGISSNLTDITPNPLFEPKIYIYMYIYYLLKYDHIISLQNNHYV
jgi:hypothetical protein